MAQLCRTVYLPSEVRKAQFFPKKSDSTFVSFFFSWTQILLGMWLYMSRFREIISWIVTLPPDITVKKLHRLLGALTYDKFFKFDVSLMLICFSLDFFQLHCCCVDFLPGRYHWLRRAEYSVICECNYCHQRSGDDDRNRSAHDSNESPCLAPMTIPFRYDGMMNMGGLFVGNSKLGYGCYVLAFSSCSLKYMRTPSW